MRVLTTILDHPYIFTSEVRRSPASRSSPKPCSRERSWKSLAAAQHLDLGGIEKGCLGGFRCRSRHCQVKVSRFYLSYFLPSLLPFPID